MSRTGMSCRGGIVITLVLSSPLLSFQHTDLFYINIVIEDGIGVGRPRHNHYAAAATIAAATRMSCTIISTQF
jgi:hypothetical protein